MDRQIVYPAQIPLDSDQLNAQRNAYMGLGQLAAMAYGWSTVSASGFACTPGSGLALVIAPGSLLAPGVVDASAYGTLAAVSSALVRQYASRDPVTLDVPGTGAAYAVYVTPATVDTDDTVLPFYNAADPAVTYAGADNSGKTAPTVRQDMAQIGIGASVPDGAYPLWTITVPAGATSITADMIAQASGAPFYKTIPELQDMEGAFLPLAGGKMDGDIDFAGYNLTINGGTRLYGNPNGHLQVFDNENALRFEIGASDGNPPFVEVPTGVQFTTNGDTLLGGLDATGTVTVPVATGDLYAVQLSQLVAEQTARANEDAVLAAGLSTSVQQQVDDNTYGIKTFGYNHVAGTLGAFDTNGGIWLIQLAGDYATNTSLANEATTRANEVADLQSGKANLAGGNAFTGVQTIEALNGGTTNVYGGEQRLSFKDTNGFARITGYINASGVRQFAFGNYDGTNYTTWFADNSTQRIIMPDGTVSAVVKDINNGALALQGTALPFMQVFDVQAVTGTAGYVATLPVTFPNACLYVLVMDTGSGCYSYGADPTSPSTVTVWAMDNTGSTSKKASMRIFAIGW